jgi:hypothetical protein
LRSGLQRHARFGRPREHRRILCLMRRDWRPHGDGAAAARLSRRADRLDVLIHHVADRLLQRRVLQQQPQQRYVDRPRRHQRRGRHALARQRGKGGPMKHED